MNTVLLTNSMGPYELGWGEDQFDLFGSRLTRGQGIFGLKGHLHAWGLHAIADNIPAKTTVIEFPSEELFKKELKKNYDFIGLQIITRHTPRIVNMVKMVREISPNTKIVIGGYGLITLYNVPPMDDPDDCADFLLENADYLCNEEGITFFRKLLGADTEEIITQSHMPLAGITIPGFEYLVNLRCPTVLVALGCPNACEFCVTSAFFKAKKIQIATPEQCFKDLKAGLSRIGNQFALFNLVWDEDFLLDKDFVMKLGELIRGENLLGEVNFFCFGSIRSISQFTAEELALCGIGAIWVGVESKFDEVITSEHGISKRSGRDVAKIFRDFQRYGITTVASTILGWDFHDRENIVEDIDYFVSLKPVLYQISPLKPCPGTVLYGRLKEQGRIYNGELKWEMGSLWDDDAHKYINFEKNEIRKYFDLAHVKLFETNGPAALNIADLMVQGFRTMLHSPNPHLQNRADKCYYFSNVLGSFLFYTIRKLAPSDAVVKRVDEIEGRYIKYIGEYSLFDKLVSRIVYLLFLYQKRKRERPNFAIKSEQPCRISYYAGDKTAPVIKREHPIKFKIERAITAIIQRIALSNKSLFPIKLKDIDDFPVDFKTKEIEGDLLNYVDEGEGEVILMLHGNPTWSYLYRHFIRDLKKDYRCIALDHLGYGLSDKPPRADYSIAAHIRRLGKFIEELDLKNITLICQDWGGIIGLSYAARNKERFKRLIPMNTCGFVPEKLGEYLKCSKGAWAFPFLWLFKTPILGKKMAMNWNIFLNLSMRLAVHNRKRQIHERAWLGYKYPFQRVNDRLAILKSVRQVPMTPFSTVGKLLKETGELIKGWDIRTQLIWGTRDPVFVKWFIDKFEELLPNHAKTFRIPTASHFLQDDEPEIIIKKIREFLSEKGASDKKKDTVKSKPVSA